MKSIRLKPGREKSVLKHHPWVFSGAIDSIEGDPGLGETVAIVSTRGEKLGWAAYSPKSKIKGRMWTYEPEEMINEVYLEKRIHDAIESREIIFQGIMPDAYRLIYAEADNFPGLIVDKYKDCLVVQFLSAGAEYWKETIVKLLVINLRPTIIYERSDVEVRKLEGLPKRKGVLFGELPRNGVEIQENGLNFLIDIENGQKTGFYLDQRNNRKEIISYANGKEMLNCFAYTGGFAIYGLAGGVKRVASIDSSEEFIKQGKNNMDLNWSSG